MSKVQQSYRPDIDGLRAVAVLLVVAYHLHLPLVHGGFIGVDIFFVISGFLITGIIARDIDASRFSLAAFYERRARRILPALVVMMLVSTLCALVYLLPLELCAYAKSLLATTFSYANVYFWSTQDYFDAPALLKPLLHTWSLAVEEQFYVILPLLLMFFARYPKSRRNLALVILLVASLAYSVWGAFHAPASAFYLLPSRAWELLAGATLALGLIPPIRQRWLAEFLSIAGLGLIIFAAWKFTAATPFPGLAALLPCLGALMIMAGGRGGRCWAGHLLSLPPMRFVGLISYSVYLWHWPLIVFTSMGFMSFIPRSPAIFRSTLFILALVLGALSWKFVEQPFRAGRMRKLSRPHLFGCTAATFTAFAFVAILLLSMGGFQSRFPVRAVEVASVPEQTQQMRAGTCFITTRFSFDSFRPDLCLHVDPSRNNYLLLGDSHSAMLWPGLQGEMAGANILQASVSGCNPVYRSSTETNCGRMMQYIFDDFLPTHRIQGVFLTARWANEQDFERLQTTIDWLNLHHIPVYCFGPVVEYDTPLPRLLAYSIAFRHSDPVDRHLQRAFFSLDKDMKLKATSDWKIHYISIIDSVCVDGHCPQYADAAETQAFLSDDNHLSNAASTLIARKILASGQLPKQNEVRPRL